MSNIDQLYTGNSGMTFGNEEESDEQQEIISEQQRQVAELMPSVNEILTACDEEIAALADIRAYIKTLGSRPTKAQIEQEYAGRELAIGFIERLKGNITGRVLTVQEQTK